MIKFDLRSVTYRTLPIRRPKQNTFFAILCFIILIPNNACAENNRMQPKGVTMLDTDIISIKEHINSPKKEPANIIKLNLIAPTNDEEPSLLVHGYYNINVDLAGHYSQKLPSPIYIVAVARSSGHVHIQNLVANDDIPARYLGNNGKPTVVKHGPTGPSTKGISHSTFFNVDLKRHLGLGSAEDTYDVFAFLEDIISKVASADKRQEQGDQQDSILYNITAPINHMHPISSASNQLAFKQTYEGTVLSGSAASNRISLIVFSISQQQPAWTTLFVKDHPGIQFDIPLKTFLPDVKPDEKVIAFAMVDGKRLAPIYLNFP